MTKKEAIKIIKSECYAFNPFNLDRTTMVNTALDMAIKALEHLPSAEPERKKGNEKCSNELPCGWCSLFDTPCFGRGGEQDG